MLIAGIDEAGRGPCFGPMAIGIAVMDSAKEKELKAAGVKDSKEILPAKRKKLVKGIEQACVEHKVLLLFPLEINDLMARESLNEIEAMKMAELINGLHERPEVIYVDSPDATKGKFEARIRKYLRKEKTSKGFDKTKIVAENKADSKYVVVGAASVLAKVKRDDEIENMHKKHGDFGSGYPSDPKTVSYLEKYVKEHKRLPPFSRIFWANCKAAMEGKDSVQTKLF